MKWISVVLQQVQPAYICLNVHIKWYLDTYEETEKLELIASAEVEDNYYCASNDQAEYWCEYFQTLLAVSTSKRQGWNKLGVTTAQIKCEHLAH